MGIPEKLDSARMVYILGLWVSGCLESGHSDIGRLALGKLDACILLSKVQSLIMVSLIAGFSFPKNESILARIW